MGKVVQIKGSNGSGKTTIAKQLIATSGSVCLLQGAKDSKFMAGRIVATVLDDLKWCVVGKYPDGSKMGGCDNLQSVNDVKAAIMTCLRYYPSYNVLFEGMMISTIKTTFYDYLLGLERSKGIEPIFIILMTNPEACIDRLRARGTMRDGLKADNIRAKCEMVARHAGSYDKRYVRWMFVEELAEKDMLKQFLTLVYLDVRRHREHNIRAYQA